MYDVDSIQVLTEKVEGFLSQNRNNLREGEVLFHLARKAPKGSTIVEIGSWQGKSTIWLGKGAERSGSCALFAIDPHTGSPEHRQGGKHVWTFDLFSQNISNAGLQHLVKPLVKSSVDAAGEVKESVDLLFIDGAHEEEAVRADLKTWFPKVKEGGVIAFHDSALGWPGVRKVVHNEVFRSPSFKKVRYIDSITYAIKAERTTFLERVENRATLVLKHVHETSLLLPQPFRSLFKKLLWQPMRRKWLRELEST